MKNSTILFILLISLKLSAQIESSILTESQVTLEEAFANAQREALTGKLEKAIEMFETLYKENRTNSAIAYELAQLYAVKKDNVLIDKYAKIAAENGPNNIWITEYYADFLLNNNRPEDALLYFKKLIVLSPGNAKYYQNAVDCHLLLKNKQNAILVYNEMEKNTGHIEEVYLSRFELYEDLGNETLALAQIDHLLKINPNNIHYLKTKAKFYIRRNQPEKAIQIYKEVLKLSPEDTEANLAILSKGDAEEKPNAYLMALMPIISNPSINIDAKVKELLPYLENMSKGNNIELINSMKELADKLVLAHPDDAKAYSLYGDVLYLSGDVDNAIIKYEKTIQLNSKVFTVWEQLMYAYMDNADYTALLKRSIRALDIYPNQATTYFFNSIANTLSGNIDEALSIAGEGKIVSGGNVVNLAQIHTATAQAFIAKKDFLSAQKALDEALKLSNSNYGFALETQADLLLAKGDNVAALQHYTTLQTKGNNTKRLSQKLLPLKGN